jgi:hypothetical protein
MKKTTFLKSLISQERYGYDAISEIVDNSDTIGDVQGSIQTLIDDLRRASDTLTNTHLDSETELT